MSNGTLYLCATPIGNLQDITLRVIETLSAVDLIACEDTRHTLKLLNHLEIKKPLVSYHEHNRQQRDSELVRRLHAGENIALVTDAGMPCVSDPGASLAAMAIEEGIPVTVLPGACAAVSALAVSGLDTQRFIFEGFLPEQNAERKVRLREIAGHVLTVILYESPHNLKRTLQDLYRELGDRRITLVRELTKIHEEIVYTTLADATTRYTEVQPRGEFVLVLAGATPEPVQAPDEAALLMMLRSARAQGLTKKEAVQQTAKQTGVKKSDVYRLAEENEL